MLLLSLAAAGPTLAQTATPAAYPVAPDPSECVVEPAPIEEIAAILGTPVAEPAGSASPFVPPASEPADAETSAEVIATLRQSLPAPTPVIRCVSPASSPTISCATFSAVCRSRICSTFSPSRRSRYRRIKNGSSSALERSSSCRTAGRESSIVLDEPDDPRIEEPDFAILEQVEGRWLVDELHEDRGVTATSATGTPAA